MFWWSESHHHLDANAKHVRTIESQQCVCEAVCIGKEQWQISKRIHTNEAKTEKHKITANNKSHKQQTFILCMTNNRPEGIRGACTEREDKAVDICQLSARNTHKRKAETSVASGGGYSFLIDFL